MKYQSCAAQVYVRNLPFQASEQDIEAFFLQAGSVEDVRRGAGPDGKINLLSGLGFALAAVLSHYR